MKNNPDVAAFYHEDTASLAYLAVDNATQRAAIVDPVLDYDEKSGRIATTFADKILDAVRDRKLRVDWILDTHPHADHFSAAAYLKEKLGAPTAIGEKVADVQALWRRIYNVPDFSVPGGAWDHLFAAGERFKLGDLECHVMLSPGHTLASITFVIGDAAFVHDTLFQPDFGTARTDFPGGDAATLYDSIQAILALPDTTRLFTGHDYKPGGRALQWEASVMAQKHENKHLRGCRDREAFVRFRQARDKTLPMPRLILHALQFNLRGGRLPAPEANDRSYLKIPINAL